MTKRFLNIDIDQLVAQRDWVINQADTIEREGLLNLLDHLIDVCEGYATPVNSTDFDVTPRSKPAKEEEA